MNGKGWKHLFYIVGYLMEPNQCFVGGGQFWVVAKNTK
jgi:hypothetical protein